MDSAAAEVAMASSIETAGAIGAGLAIGVGAIISNVGTVRGIAEEALTVEASVGGMSAGAALSMTGYVVAMGEGARAKAWARAESISAVVTPNNGSSTGVGDDAGVRTRVTGMTAGTISNTETVGDGATEREREEEGATDAAANTGTVAGAGEGAGVRARERAAEMSVASNTGTATGAGEVAKARSMAA